MQNRDKTVRRIALTAITAAIYVVFTAPMLIPIPAYGPVQYRIAEVLNLLVFFNPVFAPGVVFGVFLSNLLSPYGVLDVTIGTSATFLAVIFIRNSKNLFLASLFPIIFSGPLVGLLITLASTESPRLLSTFLVWTGWVSIGQTAVMVFTAFPLFLILQKKYPKFIEMIERV